MTLSREAIEELKWWDSEIEEAYNDIEVSEPDKVIFTDASMTGWGCEMASVSSGGSWSVEETNNHINTLEIMAIQQALMCFAQGLENKHVRIMSDNTTAIAGINNMGTNHSNVNNIEVIKIWKWCMERNIWISAAHIPGKLNKTADRESRKMNMDMEWMLNPQDLKYALNRINYVPDVDLFASHKNAQFKTFVTFKYNEKAAAIDAFSISWENKNF